MQSNLPAVKRNTNITKQNWASTCLDESRFRPLYFYPPFGTVIISRRDRTASKIPSSGQTKILIKLKLMVVDVFELLPVWKHFWNHVLSLSLSLFLLLFRASMYDRSIPIFELRKFCLPFGSCAVRILFCQICVISRIKVRNSMCWQLRSTISHPPPPVWLFFSLRFFFFFLFSFYFLFAIQFDSINHFQFPRTR